MKCILTFLATALLAVACSAAAQEPSKAPTRGDIIISAQFATAEAAAQRHDFNFVMDQLTTAMRDDVFVELSKVKQYEVAELYGMSAQALGLAGAEHIAALRATASPLATNEDWDRRMHSAIRIGDAPDAYLAFERLVRRGNHPLSTFSGRQIDWFDRLLGDLPNSVEARVALGREMEAEQWEPPYVYNDPSLVRLHYAEALLEKGELKEATAVAALITDPVVVMAMRSDRRFDPIVADVPALQDPVVVAKRYLQQARAYVRANPRMLSGRIAVIRALNILNKPDEALAYADETVEMMMHGSRTLAAFDDMEEVARFEGWKAATLMSVGRVDAGIAGLTTAASCNCSTLAMIQLGHTLMEAARPKEAQRWVTGIDEVGLAVEDRMTMSQTRACAAAQLGDQAAVAKELEFLGAHESWKPGAMVGALVCADRLDDAASLLAKQIADPHTRLAALGALQTYAAEPGDKTYAAILRARWAKLAAMPAVQAEVAKAGRLNRYELQARDALA
jgi:hypothetical protein